MTLPPEVTGVPGTLPPPPPTEGHSTDESLRTIYRWSARARRSVAQWRREESRFLWPLLAFILVLFVGDQVSASILFPLALRGPSSPEFVLLVLILVDGAIPAGSALALYAFFRSRNRRLDRDREGEDDPPTPLPSNLLEGALSELTTTELNLASIHRRIWWTVFLACFLALAVGEFVGSLLSLAYQTLSHPAVYSGLDSLLVTLGVGLAIAAPLIGWNARYWRRVEHRLGDLRREAEARRKEIGALEQTVWQRV